MPALAAIGLALVLSTPAAAETELAVGLDTTDFTYREFADSGRELNREDGILPGVRLTAHASRDLVFLRLDASLHGGTVDYDGETQTGRPLSSETDTRLITIAAEVGRWADASRRWAAFARLANRTWDREIQATGNVQGLNEEYRWIEAGVGLRRAWPREDAGAWQHELAGMLVLTLDGSVFVELSALEGRDWEDERLDLGDEAGLRLRYTATRDLGARTLRVEPYLEYWEFGRSDTEPIGGSPGGFTVYEPRSESYRLGLVVALAF